MRRFRNSLFAFALAGAACFGQSAEQLEAPAVNRVAAKLLCSCGCKMNMTCRMDPYPCPVCWENKKKILKMQTAGLSDDAILGQFQQELGKDVVAVHPGVLGSISSYAAAFLGLILVVSVIRRYRRKPVLAPAGAVDNQVLARYHEEIEKEVDRLE
jgi:hypothetical protein